MTHRCCPAALRRDNYGADELENSRRAEDDRQDEIADRRKLLAGDEDHADRVGVQRRAGEQKEQDHQRPLKILDHAEGQLVVARQIGDDGAEHDRGRHKQQRHARQRRVPAREICQEADEEQPAERDEHLCAAGILDHDARRRSRAAGGTR